MLSEIVTPLPRYFEPSGHIVVVVRRDCKANEGTDEEWVPLAVKAESLCAVLGPQQDVPRMQSLDLYKAL